MWVRSQPGQARSPLHQFGMFLVLFVCVGIIAALAAVLRTHPELRNTAAWMPYDVASETKISGVIEEVQEFQCPWSGSVLVILVSSADCYPLTLILAVLAFSVLGSLIVSTPFLHSASILGVSTSPARFRSLRKLPKERSTW